jgi:hypothetical protein
MSRTAGLEVEGGSTLVCDQLVLVDAAREALPFQLTGGQERALDNILRDMQGPLPMMCLLQVRCCPRPTPHTHAYFYCALARAWPVFLVHGWNELGGSDMSVSHSV